MLSKVQVKDIRGLSTGKGRAEAGAFVAEGEKIVGEFIRARHPIRLLAATEPWLGANAALLQSAGIAQVVPAHSDDLARASSLSAPQPVLIVADLPEAPQQLPAKEWTLVLDDIQDPGNVGTLIRIADWFGIGHVVASPASADFFNPKVVQAAMGGHLRVQLHKSTLPFFISGVQMPVIAAALGGADAYGFEKQPACALIIGNESRGISREVLQLCDYSVAIPRRGGAESLNAAVSAGILCALLSPG